ncbi:LysR substrate-binding domain-containing protein [Undibacterium sp.]|uniref:LysR substrate-binding domain-containing protein n=1 Tax=Undibacterium sp. TaxID=1914977 RepID=UPI00374DC79D
MKRAGLIELNAVVAVAAQRSFRKAAAELGMSPSALSHAVSSLEERMGVRLFNRTTRSVALSEAGAQFLARVSPALEQITDAMAGVNEFRDTPSGTIRLNAAEGAAQMVLAPIVLEFLRRYPDMQVDLVTEGRMVDIVADGFDAGIRSAEHVPLDMVAVDCSPPIRFVVVGAPSYFAGRSKPQTPGDLHSHTCIRPRLPSGALYRWEFQRGADKIDIDPPGPLTLDNHHLMIAAAVQCAGLVWTSEWHVAPLVAEGKLEMVLEPWSPYSPCLRVYYPSHRHVPAGMKAFLEVVREVNDGYKALERGR